MHAFPSIGISSLRVCHDTQIVKEGKLFAGLSARGLRVVIGVCIISNFTDIATQYALKYKAEKAH